MAWEVVAEELAVRTGKLLLKHIRAPRFVSTSLLQRNEDVRIVYAAQLRIETGGRFVLVRNLHRPETYAPFGGVMKFYPEARPALDCLQFKPQDLGPDEDMVNDLRGFVPAKNLPRMLRWYDRGADRETAADCLARELREEMREVGISSRVKIPRRMRIRPVRTVCEGPKKVEGEAYRQFRVFEVYEPVPSDSRAMSLMKRLGQLAREEAGLCVATAEEIKHGRASDACVVGQPSAYLISERSFRGHDPFFVRVSEES